MSRLTTKIEQGLAAVHAGNLQRARVCFEQALRANAGDFDALQLLGNVYLALGQFEKAYEKLQEALLLDPEFPPLLMNIGNCLSKQDEYERAIAYFDRALHARPGYEDALFNKGLVLNKLRRGAAARACLEPLMEKYPTRFDLLCEYGKALFNVGDLEAALTITDEVLSIDPAYAEALDTRGTILAAMARYGEAAREYAQATGMKPDNATFRVHQAYLQLLFGEFSAGWRGLEARFEAFAGTTFKGHPLISVLRSAKRFGRPEDFDGKSVLIVAEQGPGDNIMFASILPDLQKRARTVDLALYPRLETLLKRSLPGMRLQPWRLLSDAAFLKTYDRVVCIGSLAHAFRNRIEDFPGEPFLALDPAKVEVWRSRLGRAGKKLIGLSWKGGTPSTRAEYRSMALSDFEPIISRDDCLFVSLQHGDVAAEIAAFQQATGREIVSFPAADLHDMDDLASLIGALDAVLTVQNTNVHLSGAIGAPCLAILPAVPEWRYGAEGASMVWYKSVELFRRPAGSGLEPLLETLSARLSSIEVRSV